MKSVTDKLLNEIAKRIVKRIHPEKVILFGSYAWGVPHDSSDLDIFVIVPHSDEPSYRRARPVYNCLRGIGVPIDIIVKTHDEVERTVKVATSLSRIVMEKGKLLYG